MMLPMVLLSVLVDDTGLVSEQWLPITYIFIYTRPRVKRIDDGTDSTG